MSRSKVLTIFNEFFGEDKVDLQGSSIVVYFPTVLVTNEYGKSTLITKLFARISVSDSGRLIGTFTLNRSEYTEDEFISGYAHSHLPELNYDRLYEFRSPCLGRGPINHTCNTLNMHYDEDIWRLFCFELQQYVGVESIAGVPYKRLESIGKQGRDSYNYNFEALRYPKSGITGYLDKFYNHLIEKKILKFCYNDNCYSLAYSPYELVITLSKEFIEWYNSLPKKEQPTEEDLPYLIDKKVKVIDRVIYIRENNSRNADISAVEGKPIVTFKGQSFNLHIIPSDASKIHTSTILNTSAVGYLVCKILKQVNLLYGIKNAITSKRSTFTTPISENVTIL